MIRSITGSRSGAQGGISSFQAFAVGLAARVGIGNVAGVALAIVFGGPGALFWMWVVAIIGMATAFVESTLAQIFKERGRDFTFQAVPPTTSRTVWAPGHGGPYSRACASSASG